MPVTYSITVWKCKRAIESFIIDKVCLSPLRIREHMIAMKNEKTTLARLKALFSSFQRRRHIFHKLESILFVL